MIPSSSIPDLLPYLRRYARAITGSQKEGDSLVLSVLEIAAQDLELRRQPNTANLQLYKILLELWNRKLCKPHQQLVDFTSPSAVAQSALAGLTPISRQAFLLITMEAFPLAAAAEIMGMSEIKMLETLAIAQDEIATQIATDVLIIEDDTSIAFDIQGIIESLGHRVLARVQTYDQAIAASMVNRPGLILSDIQLADSGSGIDAVNNIRKIHNSPAIFITAYPERLLTGERSEPTFIIAKPYRVSEVKGIVSQVLFIDSTRFLNPPVQYKGR